MKRLTCHALVAFLCISKSVAQAGEPAKIVGAEPQLFLDDWIVAESTGLKRTLHQPAKKGLIKEADGRDWQRGSVYASIDSSNAVVRDKNGLFHMTYRYMWWDPAVRDLHPSIGNDKAHWFRVSTAYATSKDGIHWHKPKLGVLDGPTGFTKQAEFPFETPAGLSKDNNLGCPLIYVRDLHAHGNLTDPAKKFLVRLGRPRDTHNFATIDWQPLSFAAELPDALGKSPATGKLTPIAGGQLPPRGLLAGYDSQAKVWFSVGQDRFGTWRGRNGRDIARCTSPDLVKWEGPHLVLPVADDESKDSKDWVEYMDLVAYRAGGPQSGAWLGQLVIFRGDRSNPQYLMPGTDNVWRKGTTELRLVVSRDAGNTWQRVGGKQVWLPCSALSHGFDRLVFAAPPVEVGDEFWFYYPAWDGDHLVFNRDGSLYEPGYLRMARTGLATLRRDGYLSLDAGADTGSLLTRTIRIEGDRLEVNLQAPKGWLRAELADEAGKPIPGFTLTECAPVKGEGVSLPVRWKGGADLKRLAGKPVHVRFQLSDASLYAFRFGSGPK